MPAPRSWTTTTTAAPLLWLPRRRRKPISLLHRGPPARHLSLLRARLSIVQHPVLNMAPHATGAEGCAMRPRTGLTSTRRRTTQPSGIALAPQTAGKPSHKNGGPGLAIDDTRSPPSRGLLPRTPGSCPRATHRPRDPCRAPSPSGGAPRRPNEIDAAPPPSSGASRADSKKRAPPPPSAPPAR
jgi:hypothetical protein